MDLGNNFEGKINHLNNLKDCMTLFVKADKHEDWPERIAELMNLADFAENLQKTFQELKPQIVHEVERHTRYMSEWQKMQELAIEMHDMIEKKKEEARLRSPIPLKKCGLPQMTPNKGLLTVPNANTMKTPVSILKHLSDTPRMALSAYKQSPMIRKIRPTTLTFEDFTFKISEDSFVRIPKYMKGRETFGELVTFFENIIIGIFNEKYQLLHRVRNFVKQPAELELWRVYNEQISFFPGQHFITQSDITRKLETKSIDKKTLNKIVMLRHLGVLQEQRKQQLICYIWIASPSSAEC